MKLFGAWDIAITHTSNQTRFLFRQPTAWALAETSGVALGVLLVIAQIEEHIQPLAFNGAVLFLCGASGFWMVLRTRPPTGGRAKQIGCELLRAALLGALMLVLLRPASELLGWDALWQHNSWGRIILSYLLALTGLGYLLCRLGIWVLIRWDRLRKQRMLWGLTHAHLWVAILAALVATPIFFWLTPYSEVAQHVQDNTQDPVAALATRFFVSAFPTAVWFLVFTVLILLIVLPPSALFSFLVARKTTRRLEKLAHVTGELQKGNLHARVEVEGEDEVARLQQDFNAMAIRLENTLAELQTERDRVTQLLASRQALIASVSHELRTPVAVLRATLDSATGTWEEEPPQSLRNDLLVVNQEIVRLQGLIDDLFTLSQTETHRLTLHCQTFPPAPVITQMVAALHPLAQNSAQIEILTQIPDDIPLVYADPTRVQQILANLLRNAIRHTPPGGLILVQAKGEDDMLRLQVCDTGEGIAAQDLPYIWDRFYRGAAAVAGGPGSGLGLAIVKELSEAMQGKVAASNQPGGGCCFTVWLPRG